MPGRRSKVLTEVELELMDVVWEQGEATAGSVMEALSPERTGEAARSTVRTMLRILEKKGYLKHREEGRSYVYRPVIDREEARRRMIRHLADRISRGSTNLLVRYILELEETSREELEEIKRWIEEKTREQEEEG